MSQNFTFQIKEKESNLHNVIKASLFLDDFFSRQERKLRIDFVVRNFSVLSMRICENCANIGELESYQGRFFGKKIKLLIAHTNNPSKTKHNGSQESERNYP